MSHGYIEQKELLKIRLARAEGQVRGITRMVEDEKYCIDILTQISAVQGALDQVSLELLSDHVKHCMTNNTDAATIEQKTDELTAAVARLLRTK